MIDQIALVSAVVLPFWNIPLIVRIIRRKSSEDISMEWVMGVWVCLGLMTPSAFRSPDLVWKVYSIINFVLFTFVVATVFLFRKKKEKF
jgi:uncharacterized protein with PQ loop repeat